MRRALPVLAGILCAAALVTASLIAMYRDVIPFQDWPTFGGSGSGTEQVIAQRVAPRIERAGGLRGPGEGTVVPATILTPTTLRVGSSAPAEADAGETSQAPTRGVETDGDEDGDGLNDASEKRLGTRAHKADTDDDGIPDGWEARHDLNPLVASDASADADSDGLTNRTEYVVDRDPHVADTNGDGVPDGDDDLDGDGVPNAVEQALSLNPAKRVSLGTTPDGDRDADHDGLPNATELRLGLDPARADTTGMPDGQVDSDGDGLSNEVEVALGLDPSRASTGDVPDGDADTDTDGLPNALEIELGLNPAKVDSDDNGVVDGAEDTDGDGVANAAELAAGTDPAKADKPAEDKPQPETEPADDAPATEDETSTTTPEQPATEKPAKSHRHRHRPNRPDPQDEAETPATEQPSTETTTTTTPAARPAPAPATTTTPTTGTPTTTTDAPAPATTEQQAPATTETAPAPRRRPPRPAARRPPGPEPGILPGHGARDHHRLGDLRPAGLESSGREAVDDPLRRAQVTRGRFAGHDVLHVSRHRDDHERLSSHVTHQANVVALKELGAARARRHRLRRARPDPRARRARSSSTTCTSSPTGSPTARCARSYTGRATPGRGHWVFEDPFSEPLRAALLAAAREPATPSATAAATATSTARASTRSRDPLPARRRRERGEPDRGPRDGAVRRGGAALRAARATSTDYANGVAEEPTPVETLMRLLRESGATLADTLAAAVGRIDLDAVPPVGTQIAWESPRRGWAHTDHGSRRRRRT